MLYHTHAAPSGFTFIKLCSLVLYKKSIIEQYHTKKKENRKKQGKFMKKYENDNITVRVCGYPRCCSKPMGKMVQVCTCTHMGMGFAGMGLGWTSPTCAIPVCHPSGVRWVTWHPVFLFCDH